MIQRFYDKKNPPKFYRLKISAPDGRFTGDYLVGGIDKNLMEYEAKRASDMGMLVHVFKEK